MYETLYRSDVDHWWYRVRREMVHAFIRRYGGTSERPLKILDAGCGTGTLLAELARYGDAYGVDASAEAVEFCRRRGLSRVQKGGLGVIAFPDSMFDWVLALDVLEHVVDDAEALAEIHRVLKPGGILLVFAPAFMFLWGVTDVLSHHYRRYASRELCAKVKQRGFVVLRASYFNFFFFLPILFIRWFVRFFRVPMRSEYAAGAGVLNALLYCIFHCESRLLEAVSFPFGVSLFIVARKI